MSNLVPLYLDKDTGHWPVAKHGAGQGIPAGLFPAYGFLYIHAEASKLWTVEHNFDSRDIITQVFSDTGEQILPNGINIIDQNILEIDFGTAQAGKALLVIFRNSE